MPPGGSKRVYGSARGQFYRESPRPNRAATVREWFPPSSGARRTLVPYGEKNRIVDRVNRAVHTGHRGRVSFSDACRKSHLLAQGIGGKVPSVQVAVLAIRQDGFAGDIHGRGVDAPLLYALGKVGGRAQNG